MKTPGKLGIVFTLTCAALAGWIQVPARAAPGDLDTTFNPDCNGYVYCVAVQHDGKIIIGGDFAFVGTTLRYRIARLNSNGSVDTSFNPGTGANDSVYFATIQTNGEILIGGKFTSVNGIPRNRIARLHTDGSLDTSFDPNCNVEVRCATQQTDGRIIIGGDFTTVAGVTRNRIARLNFDGSLDTEFNPDCDSGIWSCGVHCVAVQLDGKIIIGGTFSNVAGRSQPGLARLNPDGSLDLDFVNSHFQGNPLLSMCVAVQPDGKIVIGENVLLPSGVQTRQYNIYRLNPDSSADLSFNPATTTATFAPVVGCMAIQADGKIIVAGGVYGGSYCTRLNSNGSLDTSFNTNLNGTVYGAALQADGKVIVVGAFTAVGGTTRNRIARLNNGGPTWSLSVPNLSTVKWLRGGTTPEATRVLFDYVADGSSFFLGEGYRITGGWQITGVSIPEVAYVRAFALTSGGQSNGSTGMVSASISIPYTPPTPTPTPADTWTQYYSLANYYYNLYAAYGYWNYAAAIYYYYSGLGNYNYYTAYGSGPLGTYHYYNGLGLYYLYLYYSNSYGVSYYYYYLALAYYYYYAGLGDYTMAELYYNKFMLYAFGVM